MTTLRPFTCNDIFKYNNVNLDPLTETYGVCFYVQYLAHWPEYFQVAESPSGEIMGYIMGKAEGHGENWHGHVTALSVGPEYRRLGLAATLMAFLEDVSEKKRAYFVDLFVRVSNRVAINMYKQLGYIVYRTVLEYYSGDPDEDAYDMRKACSRDVDKLSVIPLSHPDALTKPFPELKEGSMAIMVTRTIGFVGIALDGFTVHCDKITVKSMKIISENWRRTVADDGQHMKIGNHHQKSIILFWTTAVVNLKKKPVQ